MVLKSIRKKLLNILALWWVPAPWCHAQGDQRGHQSECLIQQAFSPCTHILRPKKDRSLLVSYAFATFAIRMVRTMLCSPLRKISNTRHKTTRWKYNTKRAGIHKSISNSFYRIWSRTYNAKVEVIIFVWQVGVLSCGSVEIDEARTETRKKT